MNGEMPAANQSKALYWTGWVLSVLPSLLLTMSGVMKLMKPAEVVDGFAKLGYPAAALTGLGVVELVSTLLYLIPRTSVLGAILLTGYLGGATASHLRLEEPYFMPVVLGVVIWLGLYLREPRLRALTPLKS